MMDAGGKPMLAPGAMSGGGVRVKAVLRCVAAIALMVATLLPALSAAARPMDPESWRVTRPAKVDCRLDVSFGDPLPAGCSSGMAARINYRSLWQQAEPVSYCAVPKIA
jgi:hypothetical protein